MKLKNYISFLILLFLSNSILAQVKDNEILSKTKNGIPKMIRFEQTKISSDKNSVISFLKEQYKTDSQMEFKPSKRKGKERKGFTSQKYNQYYKGIKVEFARINTVSKNGSLHFVNGSFINVKDLSVNPAITESTAIELAKKYIGAEKYMWENTDNEQFIKQLKNDTNATYFPQGELVIMREDVSDELSNPVLAYKIKIFAELPFSKDDVYINASSGKVIFKSTLLCDVEGTAQTRYSGTRTIETEQVGSQYRLRDYSRGNGIETFNLNNSSGYSNITDFIDNDNNWTSAEYDNANRDNAALDLHWGVEMTFDYFFQNHNYSSFDGQGMVIKAYANWSNLNAQWDASEEVIRFGNGNSSTFDALTSLDVVGHEFAHGIDHFSSNLTYINESGALDEGIADIWGAMVESFAAPEKNTYLIGEDIKLDQDALRSMINPKTFNNPDTYQGVNWYFGSGDSGGVHTNSGVMGHWFYLLAEGSSATDEINDNNDTFSFTGIGIEKASNILFHAQHTYFSDPLMGYITASNLIIQSAKDLYGIDSDEVFKVKYAWFAVGIGTEPTIIVTHFIQGQTQLTPGYRALYSMNPYENATNYVWSIPTGCHYNYCWGITQGQGTNVLGIKAGNTGIQDITCIIYNGSTVIGSQYITVNVQNPYGGGGGGGNGDPCGEIEMVNGVIYPPDPCDSNGFTTEKTLFKNILVYDFSGRKVLELKNVDSFSINFLSSGLYILKMELSNNEIITKKILK
jgi:Zn-dependent metalloprotease